MYEINGSCDSWDQWVMRSLGHEINGSWDQCVMWSMNLTWDQSTMGSMNQEINGLCESWDQWIMWIMRSICYENNGYGSWDQCVVRLLDLSHDVFISCNHNSLMWWFILHGIIGWVDDGINGSCDQWILNDDSLINGSCMSSMIHEINESWNQWIMQEINGTLDQWIMRSMDRVIIMHLLHDPLISS